MPQENAAQGQDHDPKTEGEQSHGSESGPDLSRFVINTAFELLGGVAQASAEAFKTLNSHVSAEKSDVVEGLLRGNARFLEHLSRTTEKIAEQVASEKRKG